MSRANQLLELLEAVQLGSLGASSSASMRSPGAVGSSNPSPEAVGNQEDEDEPKITHPQKRSDKVTRVSWIPGDRFQSSWVYGVQWSESNKNKFHMTCGGSNGKYHIYISGGKKMTVTYPEGNYSGRAMASDFHGSHEFTASDNDDAKKKFEHIVKTIQQSGSFAYALASGAIGHWKIETTHRGWMSFNNIYLVNATGMDDTPYMTITHVRQ